MSTRFRRTLEMAGRFIPFLLTIVYDIKKKYAGLPRNLEFGGVTYLTIAVVCTGVPLIAQRQGSSIVHRPRNSIRSSAVSLF